MTKETSRPPSTQSLHGLSLRVGKIIDASAQGWGIVGLIVFAAIICALAIALL